MGRADAQARRDDLLDFFREAAAERDAPDQAEDLGPSDGESLPPMD
jgi:hypothetical protein